VRYGPDEVWFRVDPVRYRSNEVPCGMVSVRSGEVWVCEVLLQ